MEEAEFIFDEERRAKSARRILASEIAIEGLKMRDGNTKDGKYLQSFHDGYMSGIALALGAIETYIEQARIDETIGDILCGLTDELGAGLKLLKDGVGTYT